MKIIAWLAAASGLACLAGPEAAPSGPRIQFDSTDYNLGQVMSGEVVIHAYTFTNTGNEDLVVESVRPGCGCTQAGPWTRVTKPGQTGRVSLQLNTLGFNGKVAKWATYVQRGTQPSRNPGTAGHGLEGR